MIVANTGTPNSLAFSALITTTAAAPSLIPEALPAVTVPSFLNTGRSLESPSNEASFLGNSSVSNTIGSPRRCGISTGTISSLKRPASIAATARCCDCTAKLSWSSRVIPYCSATFSAVIPMWKPSKPSVKPSRSIVSTTLESPIREPQRWF